LLLAKKTLSDPKPRLSKEQVETKIKEIENNPNLNDTTKAERREQYDLSLKIKKEREGLKKKL
jgi:hypothetical protein